MNRFIAHCAQKVRWAPCRRSWSQTLHRPLGLLGGSFKDQRLIELEVILPTHRLQYQKDPEGRYQALALVGRQTRMHGFLCVSSSSEGMELVCELPGVSDMGCIAAWTRWHWRYLAMLSVRCDGLRTKKVLDIAEKHLRLNTVARASGNQECMRTPFYLPVRTLRPSMPSMQGLFRCRAQLQIPARAGKKVDSRRFSLSLLVPKLSRSLSSLTLPEAELNCRSQKPSKTYSHRAVQSTSF